SRYNGLALWDARTGKERWSLKSSNENQGKPVTSIAFSPDGNHLAGAVMGNRVFVWSTDDGREKHANGFTRAPDPAAMDGSSDASPGWAAVAFSPNGKRLAASDHDGMVTFWNGETGQRLREWRTGARTAIGMYAGPSYRPIAFSSDGRHLATGDRDT